MFVGTCKEIGTRESPFDGKPSITCASGVEGDANKVQAFSMRIEPQIADTEGIGHTIVT